LDDIVSMREKTCCFTGHRDLPAKEQEQISRKLEHTIAGLIQTGVCRFMAGGAVGFDTLAAQTVLKLREEYPQVSLILILPCLTQTRGWPEEDIAAYEQIKAAADEVVYSSQQYMRGCMFKRNRHLVDNSGICVCYLTENNGGTAYTVKYARTQGVPVVNLALVQDTQDVIQAIKFK